jgi:hypothetical protein
MVSTALDAKLAALADMPLAQLRETWTSETSKPVPRVSAVLLRLALAWDLQAAVHGGLPRRSVQTLGQLATGKTQTSALRPGMRLMREWNGTLHIVTVDDGGSICWNGKHWASLSKVAREITGTRWSGPAFFGLKQKKAA